MATLGDLKNRVQTWVGYSQSTVVRAAIIDAVKFFQHEDFWFSRKHASFLLSTSETVGFPIDGPIADLAHIHNIQVNTSGNTNEVFWLPVRDFFSLDPTKKAIAPAFYSVLGKSLYFWPKIDSPTITCEVQYTRAITLTNSLSASSEWTNEAEELIFLHAASSVSELYLRNLENAQIWRGYEKVVYRQMKIRSDMYHKEEPSKDIIVPGDQKL